MKPPDYNDTVAAIFSKEFLQWPTEVQKQALGLEHPLNQETPLHWAASSRQLPSIPKSLLTKELLLKKDKEGITPLHHAAWAKALKDIPQELLQADTLTQKTDTGWTVIHWAAAKGQLHHLPKGRLSMSQIKTLLAGTSQTDKPSDYLKAWLKEEKKLQIQQSLSEWDHPAI